MSCPAWRPEMFLAHPGRPARSSPFHPALSDLPEALPLFPLSGAVVLPNCDLPLNIFEPRYLAMTREALGAPQRLIGLIQPSEKAEREDAEDSVLNPGALELSDLREVGCAGRIVSFAETSDGRYIVALRGVCRFRLKDEPEMDAAGAGFARVRPLWGGYAGDLAPSGTGDMPDMAELRDLTVEYLESREMKPGDAFADGMTGEEFVNNMAMLCPFAGAEKQALLEAEDLARRAETLKTIMTMSLHAGGGGEKRAH